MAAVAREVADGSSRLERVAARFSRSITIVSYDDRFRSSALEVAREIHAHSLYRDMPLLEDKVIEQLSMAGSGDARWRYFRLAVRGDQVLGGFFGVLLRVFWCDALLAKDMGWWVRSSARGGAAAILLLNDFEAWARGHGATMAGIAQSGVENIERTGQLFRNCGYRFTGYNTAKDL